MRQHGCPTPQPVPVSASSAALCRVRLEPGCRSECARTCSSWRHFQPGTDDPPGSIWLAGLDALIDITHAVARGVSLRRHFFTIPARLVWPGLNADLPYTHWTWARYWLILWHTIIGYSHPHPSPP